MVQTFSSYDEAASIARRSTLVNRNVTVDGHRTSIRLEPAMWEALRQISAREGMSLHQLVTEIAHGRLESSLTAAIRVHLLVYFMAAATDEGHRRAGHGGRATHFLLQRSAAHRPV